MSSAEEPLDPAAAREVLASLTERQRLLRSAYHSARYGWPEIPAPEWARRPHTFTDDEPRCRVTDFLEALRDPRLDSTG